MTKKKAKKSAPKPLKPSVPAQTDPILEILSQKGPMAPHDIHEELTKSHGVELSRAAFDEHLNQLANSGLVHPVFAIATCNELHEVCKVLEATGKAMSPAEVQKGVKSCS